MSDDFLCNLIPEIEAKITAAMTAQDGLISGAIAEYRFNTGQTDQTVKKQDIEKLQAYIDMLLARRDTLRQRCGLDNSTFQATPGW